MTEVVKITIRRDFPAGQAAIAPQPNPFTPAPKLVAVGPGTGEGGGGGGLTDGDKGDIIVSGGGTALNIDPAVLTASGRALTSSATVAAQRTALGLGTAALASATAFDPSGTSSAALATHVGEGDPHPGYLTEAAATVALAGKADLVGGVIPTSQIPALAITAYLGAVASDAAMLALVGERGDWCNRSDNPKGSFILIADDPTLIASWQRLETPGAPVISVNAQTGVIVLGPADVGATPAAHAGSGGSEHPGAIAGGDGGFMSGADKTKLDGVAAGATVNASDAALLDRANHTGTQSADTISDFAEGARDVIGTALTGTANRLIVTVNDAGDTITLDVVDEGIQDIIGAMVVAAGGSYDDVAGTITLPTAPAYTDEQVRDVIGTALTGTANRVVVTVNDAGDTITLDVVDEGIQDIIGAMVVAAGGSYDDVAGTIALPPASVAASLLADGAAAAPATPAGDNLALFASLVGGLAMPTALDATGKAYVLQPAMFNRPMRTIQPGSASTPTQLGPPLTLTGTVSHPVIASTNYKTSRARISIATTATAGAVAGFRNAQTGEVYRRYGFLFHDSVSIGALVASQRGATGLADSAVALTNIDPLSAAGLGRIVLGYRNGGGNMIIAHCLNGATPTEIDLGANFPANTTDLYDFFIGCAPNGNPVWFVGRFNTDGGYSFTQTAVIATNMPALTTNLLRWGLVGNNTTASICAMEVGQVSLWPVQ